MLFNENEKKLIKFYHLENLPKNLNTQNILENLKTVKLIDYTHVYATEKGKIHYLENL